jgi:hypothetical protein
VVGRVEIQHLEISNMLGCQRDGNLTSCLTGNPRILLAVLELKRIGRVEAAADRDTRLLTARAVILAGRTLFGISKLDHRRSRLGALRTRM